jgi:FAD/FMN-containing dehydrogenase
MGSVARPAVTDAGAASSTDSLANVSEYQVTYWRDLPSLVVVRDGDVVTKGPLAQRFQEAIDEAAMRLGETDSGSYLEGWTRGEWTPAEGGGPEVCDRVVAELETSWPPGRVTEFLDGLGPPADAGTS